jgi:hypothetical protein
MYSISEWMHHNVFFMNVPMNTPNIFDVEGNNRLLPGRQPLTTGSVLKICFFSNCICSTDIILIVNNYVRYNNSY